MKICEYEFAMEDPALPGYSLMEVDVFVDHRPGRPSARVSIRKNMRSDKFELYRRDIAPGKDEFVLRSGSLSDVVLAANLAVRERWGEAGTDYVCDHATCEGGERFREDGP